MSTFKVGDRVVVNAVPTPTSATTLQALASIVALTSCLRDLTLGNIYTLTDVVEHLNEESTVELRDDVNSLVELLESHVTLVH